MSEDDDDEGDYPSRSTMPKNSSSSETHDDDADDDDHHQQQQQGSTDDNGNARVQHPLLYNQLLGSGNDGAVDLSRTEVKTGNLLTTVPSKSPSPLTPSPSPPNESLLQILANQILKTAHHDTVSQTATSRLLTIASPTESKPTAAQKRSLNVLKQDEEEKKDEQQQQKWDDAAMTLLSLNKLPAPEPMEQQTALQSVCQSVINGLLRRPAAPRATIDYHSNNSIHRQQMQGENFHHHHHHNSHHHQDNINSLAQLKTLMNYFSTPSNSSFPAPSLQQSSTCVSERSATNISASHEHSQQQQQQQQELRGDMMPLKLRMKMLNAKI